MNQLITDDIVVYIILLVSIVVLFQAYNKISYRTLYVKSAARTLLYVLVFTLIASGAFYWRLRGITAQSSFDTWVSGLDITLVHVIITVPIFFESFYIATLLAQILVAVLAAIVWLISKLTGIIFKKNIGVQERVDTIIATPACILIISRPVIAFIGAVWFVWFLFIGTIDLQQILFGNYDSSVGWNFPTTFRFTVLYERWNNFIGVNQEFTTIISFIVFAVSIVLGVASLLKAIKDIGENLKNA